MMEEERPLQEARQALSGEPATVTPSSGPPEKSGNRKIVAVAVVVGVVVVIGLLIAGLFLPPISLADRLSGGGETAQATAETTDGAVAVSGGTASDGEITVAADGAAVDVTSIPITDFVNNAAGDEAAAMAAAIPAGATVVSNVYVMSYDGTAPEGSVSLPAPAGKERTVDLYGWDGSAWAFVPHTQKDGQMTSARMALPVAVTLLETAPPATAAIGADLQPQGALPAVVLPYLTEVTVGRLMLAADGALTGEVAELTTGGYQQLLQVSNVGAIIDQAAITQLLGDTALADQHIAAIVAQSDAYNGVNLDYQAIPAGVRDNFTSFVSRLANALHAEGKSLIVTVDTPAQTNLGDWDSAGQDWAAIGEIADAVYVQMPLNPSVYHEEGQAQKLIDWAVTQIERQKLTLVVTAYAVDTIGTVYRTVDNDQALASFGELNITEGAEEVEPETAVEVGLAGTASALEWDSDSLMYKYTYEENGQTHTVWLSNEAALSRQVNAARSYNVRGISVTGMGTGGAQGDGYVAALEGYVNNGAAPEVAGAAISWTVQNTAGDVVASSSGDALIYRWDGSAEPGTYVINAEFAQGNSVAKLGSIEIVVAKLDEEVAESPPTPAATAAPAPTAGAVVPAPTVAPIDPGTADAVVGIAANLRTGPGVAYPVVEVVQVGTRVAISGRSANSEWVVVNFDEKEGWLFASLLSLNPALQIASLPVVEPPPLVVGGGDDGGGGNPLPPPPPPAAGGSFELGGQTVGSPRTAVMRSAGMTWVKRQHKWGPGNTGQDVAGLVADGHGNGFKVLLSIPGQLNPSSIDYGAYVAFLGQVASLPDPPDAIEIWNEMNIDREWPSGQISPQTYVNSMLIPAYTAIKNANPNILVITGAPAPTGFWGGGCTGGGCDDAPYIAGMMAAGAGSYSDCIGVHYNEGIMPPAATSGDPRGNGGHYTRYFQGMVNAYVGAGAGTLCFTELGYLSGEEWGYVPGGFLWRAPYNLTVAEHAQYLAEAASLAANSGRVRLMIIFNVDFTNWGDDPMAGYAMIRPNGSCPACILLGQVMGVQ